MKKLIYLFILLLPLTSFAQEEDPIKLYNSGVKAQNNGYQTKAIEYYTQCIKLKPEYVKAYHNRGLIYYNKKEYDKAIADCDKGIAIDKSYIFFYNIKGFAYKLQKKYKEAIAAFSNEIKYAANNKDKAEAYNNRAWCYDKMLNNKAKLADFKKAVELAPNNANYQYNCGRAKFDVGGDTYKTAVDNFTKVIELEPKNKDGYAERATYYMTFQQFDKALKDLKKAKELGAEVDHLLEAAKFELEMQEGN